jgi:hypothetical protein
LEFKTQPNNILLISQDLIGFLKLEDIGVSICSMHKSDGFALDLSCSPHFVIFHSVCVQFTDGLRPDFAADLPTF